MNPSCVLVQSRKYYSKPFKLQACNLFLDLKCYLTSCCLYLYYHSNCYEYCPLERTDRQVMSAICVQPCFWDICVYCTLAWIHFLKTTYEILAVSWLSVIIKPRQKSNDFFVSTLLNRLPLALVLLFLCSRWLTVGRWRFCAATATLPAITTCTENKTIQSTSISSSI